MFQGIFIFGIAAVVVVVAYIAMMIGRRREESDLPEEDRLTEEEFHKIEYGDDD